MDAPTTRIVTPVGILAQTYNVERVDRIPGWLRRRTTRAVRVTVTTQSVGSRRITLRSDGHGSSSVGARALARLRTGWRAQLLLFGAAYAVYNVARWLFVGDLPQAQEDARWIVGLERGAGVAIEGSVQGALDSRSASWLLSNVYLVAQFVVVPGALIWLYRRSRHVYRQLRDTLLATWLIAVPIFALFPVAPPRLAGIGIADTVSHHAAVALTGRSTIFYNQLAAVPSLHVGFAVAVGLALAAALRPRWARTLALLWGPLVALAVVATGNHYLFDIVAGLLVTSLGFAAGRLPAQLRQPTRAHGSLRRLAPPTAPSPTTRSPSCSAHRNGYGAAAGQISDVGAQHSA